MAAASMRRRLVLYTCPVLHEIDELVQEMQTIGMAFNIAGTFYGQRFADGSATCFDESNMDTTDTLKCVGRFI